MPPSSYKRNKMAIPPLDGSIAGAGGAGWIPWQKLSNIAVVFSIFVAGGLIPLAIYLHKKYKSMRDYNTNKVNDNIKKIATEISKKIDDKLEQHIDKQEESNELISKTIQKLSEKLDDQSDQNKAILSTVRTLTKDFHDFKDKQIEINAKVSYIDDIIRQNLKWNIDNNSNSR
ncbi:MAG: hypothetical protein L0H53_04490 [Candidatus Nitrosocosmicus sp.]|nr:hypothetical protein [Candidatus Nitrosocosmicus sp.]MDN5866230.1 hypothetical protein [Candidatus Nitrosocosmicus sp.]